MSVYSAYAISEPMLQNAKLSDIFIIGFFLSFWQQASGWKDTYDIGILSLVKRSITLSFDIDYYHSIRN